MAITTLEMLSVWSAPPNVAGATCFGYFRDALDWRLSERVDNDESCTVTVPFTSLGASIAGVRRVLVLHFAPVSPGAAGDTRSYRIMEVRSEQTAGGVRAVMQARTLSVDLTDCGVVRDVLAGGTELFTIAGSLTLAQWLDNYILPQLQRAGYAYYVRSATVNATIVSIAGEMLTCRALLDQVLAQIDQEWQLAASGGSIVLDFSAAHLADTALPLRLTTGHNLRRLSRRNASIDQATILQPVGGRGHSEVSRSIQHHAIQPANLNVPAGSFDVLNAPDVTASNWEIVRRDDQWVGYYLQQQRTGRCFQILAVDNAAVAPPGGRVYVADASTLAFLPAGVLGNGYMELRRGLTPGTRIDVTKPGVPLRLTAIPSTTVTVDNPFTGADPVPTDDVHVDCRTAPAFQVRATTSTTVSTVTTVEQDLTVASTASVAVGDWGFAHNNVGTPWTLFGKVFTVTQVVSGTVVRIQTRYSWDTALPFTAGALVKQVQFYRARAASPYVQDELAATNQLVVTSTSGLAVNDLIEYHLDNSGALVSGLASPTSAVIAAGGYGEIWKTADFSTARCVVNLLNSAVFGNPWFDTWTGAAGSAPDGWTKSSGSVTKVTTALPGPGTINAMRGTSNDVTSPVFYVRPTAGDSKVSVRVRLRTGAGIAWDGPTLHQFRVDVIWGGSNIIGSLVLVPPNYPAKPAAYVEVEPDTVVDADLLAVDCLHSSLAGFGYGPWDGLQLKLGFSTGSITVGGVMVLQDSTLPESGYMVKDADQSLFGLGQLRHAAIDEADIAYDIDAVDLGRLLTTTFPAEELMKGRTVRVESDVLGVAFEERLAEIEYSGTADGDTSVTVQTRRRDIADILAARL